MHNKTQFAPHVWGILSTWQEEASWFLPAAPPPEHPKAFTGVAVEKAGYPPASSFHGVLAPPCPKYSRQKCFPRAYKYFCHLLLLVPPQTIQSLKSQAHLSLQFLGMPDTQAEPGQAWSCLGQAPNPALPHIMFPTRVGITVPAARPYSCAAWGARKAQLPPGPDKSLGKMTLTRQQPAAGPWPVLRCCRASGI